MPVGRGAGQALPAKPLELAIEMADVVTVPPNVVDPVHVTSVVVLPENVS
jgi:hypothetical protein